MPGAGLVRLRVALTAFFALDGFVLAGWMVRIRAVKERTGAFAGALGPALLDTGLAGGSTAAAGMPLGTLAPSLRAGPLGYAVTGPGLANLFPVAVERAGALAGPGGVATASILGYGGMPLGPPRSASRRTGPVPRPR